MADDTRTDFEEEADREIGEINAEAVDNYMKEHGPVEEEVDAGDKNKIVGTCAHCNDPIRQWQRSRDDGNGEMHSGCAEMVEAGGEILEIDKSGVESAELVEGKEYKGYDPPVGSVGMDPPLLVDIENRFTYHAPKEGQSDKYELVRLKAKILAFYLIDMAPASRERSLAITHLEEAVFWVNAAIARHG